MQTEVKMLTEDYRPGVEGRLGSKTTCFPGKTSRVTWDRGRVSCERLKIIVTAINVLNFTSSDGFGVGILRTLRNDH